MKKCLFLGRKTITNRDSILKSKDIALLTKIHIVKAMVFPVVMCRCKSWTDPCLTKSSGILIILMEERVLGSLYLSAQGFLISVLRV